ncbi:MAG: hypothetical protein NTW50_02155 [Candidatus Berkelbacteria bacterium]|nr:hypothetical protein [Candidatus Berkelbacteria bacterium]
MNWLLYLVGKELGKLADWSIKHSKQELSLEEPNNTTPFFALTWTKDSNKEKAKAHIDAYYTARSIGNAKQETLHKMEVFRISFEDYCHSVNLECTSLSLRPFGWCDTGVYQVDNRLITMNPLVESNVCLPNDALCAVQKILNSKYRDSVVIKILRSNHDEIGLIAEFLGTNYHIWGWPIQSTQ